MQIWKEAQLGDKLSIGRVRDTRVQKILTTLAEFLTEDWVMVYDRPPRADCSILIRAVCVAQVCAGLP